MITKFLRLLFGTIGTIFSYFSITKISYPIYLAKREFVTQLWRRNFKSFGKNSLIGLNTRIIKPKYMSIGNNSSICDGVVLRCNVAVQTIGNYPTLEIGDNVSIGEFSHITCANEVKIGNNVLTGKKILITDNSHGKSTRNILDIAPILREIVSSGPVIIEDNVWIGEKATILPNVKVGRGSIIAANSVVTKDIPPYTVAGGIPAKILKTL